MPAAAFDVLIDALNDPQFVASNAAHGILECFEQEVLLGKELRRLSEEQKNRFLEAMENAYPNAAYHVRFHISMILGEWMLDAEALAVLVRLRGTPGFDARDIVAHGLQHFAVAAAGQRLRDDAVAALELMADDPDADVRKNVAYWLANVRAGRAF